MDKAPLPQLQGSQSNPDYVLTKNEIKCMHRSPQEHRDEICKQGYTIFEGVLSQQEIKDTQPIFDELIKPDTAPPIVTGNKDSRRQLNYQNSCEPRISRFGHHPQVLEAVQRMFDRPYLMNRTPIPTVTFPGKAGGIPGELWWGHVDWHSKPPKAFELDYIHGIIHFTTVKPKGGGFTLIPRSHRVVEKNLDDEQMLHRMYRAEFHDFPGLEREVEITATAGDLLFYHPLLIHNASDNRSETTRKVLHAAFLPASDEAKKELPAPALRFHPDYLAVLDEQTKQRIDGTPH